METTSIPPRTNSPDHSAEHALHNQTADLKASAEQTAHEAKEKATQAYEEAKEGARKVAKDSANYATGVVSSQKSALVAKLDEYQSAIQAASEKLESEDDSAAAAKIRKASKGLGNVTDFLRDTEPRELYDEAGRLARKHPELVFGGLFIAGLGIARFLKASASERQNDHYTGYSRPKSDSQNYDRPAITSPNPNTPFS